MAEESYQTPCIVRRTA